MTQTILVTGGVGFIGSHFVQDALKAGYHVVNIDCLSYAASTDTLAALNEHKNHTFIRGNICDRQHVQNILDTYNPTYVIHFAAESHVDRSIDGPDTFLKTNVEGTFSLLEALRKYQKSVSFKKFIHVSTDEVYGSTTPNHPFTEQSPNLPSSPYAASKSASDQFVLSYMKTYNLPALITRCTNNYGSFQFPEKLIPHMIISALQNAPLPIYGDGQQIRDWLYVKDHTNALMKLMASPLVGEIFNIGAAGHPISNLEIVKNICQVLDEIKPREDKQSYSKKIVHVADRPAHDTCYALDIHKIQNAINWRPRVSLKEGLKKTINWYISHQFWWQNILQGNYTHERIGLGTTKKA